MTVYAEKKSLIFDGLTFCGAMVYILLLCLVFGTFFIGAKVWNHLEILISAQVRDAVFISLQTSLLVVFFTFVLGLPVAYILALKEFKGKVVVDTLIDLPVIFPPLVSGLALLLLLGPNGPLGVLFEKLDLSLLFTKKAIIAAQFFVSSPFFIKTARESIAAIPENLLSASYTLRGSRAYTFFHVILPLSRNGLCAGLVMCWTRALGEFGATAMVAGSIPGQTRTMTLSIYSDAMSGDLKAATATAFILTVFAFVSLIIVKNIFKKYQHVYQN
jgi:molybdate transport system permease protein